ncbi:MULTISPECIES: hypothetical protein [Sphingopyxis]|jgi:pyruvate/2-oxoglutarate/acetoin dehydrogenase E1 component|uniref:hypothetical protein n=1 Tax=Sphingopyxis TaxID=165697 RepID=UPI00086AE830|nr:MULTISPECIES: hypothetical protein [Sphingopyxis]APW72153.1 hypothetical protein BWD40_04095 [Sphingopyxis granuli]AVA12905.1 hypothetical protein C3E99_02740 [Sphingopyxis sp. MG]ODU26684.1 MAG: hypothetical protein ABS88_17255 [Sphingopyxis sp. SCN 67-31]
MSDRPANGVRTLSYRAALREALIEEMQRDERVFMIGQDLSSPASGEAARQSGAWAGRAGLLRAV